MVIDGYMCTCFCNTTPNTRWKYMTIVMYIPIGISDVVPNKLVGIRPIQARS